MDTIPAPKVEGIFFAYNKEEVLFLPNLWTRKMLRFLWRIQICMKNMKIFFTPLPILTRPCSSCVTHHSSLWGGGG